MHKSEFVFKNETHEILRYFVTRSDHFISVRSPNLELINMKKKKTRHLTDFEVQAKKEIKHRHLDFGREHENDRDTNRNRCKMLR